MTDFSKYLCKKVLLRKVPFCDTFEACIQQMSPNEQYVELKLCNGEVVWESIDCLKLLDVIP